jgi:drug/metabolite transporter (DMT)-like permease
MAKILMILVIAFMFEAVGVIALKKGVDQVVVRYEERKGKMAAWKNILFMVGNGFANKNVLLGLLLETIFFVFLLYCLGQRDVSFIWPLTSLSFVMTTLAAQFILRENVSAVRWGGVALIMVGAAFISYSEHLKDNQPKLVASTPGTPPVTPPQP